MSNFPTGKKDRTHWSVWRGGTWLGEWHGTPTVGAKVKPKECLTSKKVVSFDRDTGRIFVQ